MGGHVVLSSALRCGHKVGMQADQKEAKRRCLTHKTGSRPPSFTVRARPRRHRERELAGPLRIRRRADAVDRPQQ